MQGRLGYASAIETVVPVPIREAALAWLAFDTSLARELTDCIDATARVDSVVA